MPQKPPDGRWPCYRGSTGVRKWQPVPPPAASAQCRSSSATPSIVPANKEITTIVISVTTSFAVRTINY